MVTEPPLPELEAGLFKEEAVEDDALLEEVVEVVKEAVELGEPEVCLLLFKPISKLVDSLLLDLFAFFDLPVVSLTIPEVAIELTVIKGSFIHKLNTIFSMQTTLEFEFANS